MPTTVELKLPQGDPQAWVRSTCLEMGLESSLETSLRGGKDYHWHWRMPGQSGTLELTFTASENRLTVQVRSNRVGLWTDKAIALLITRSDGAI